MAKRYSTSTVRSDGGIVPWLAAEGPLAYSPENPPESNYFFQYSWLMPSVYRDKRHYYFGKPSSLSRGDFGWGIEPFVDFWSKARAGAVAPIYVVMGGKCDGGFAAPIACYRYQTGWDNRDMYLLIQHGSYLDFDVAEQPLIKDGLLMLFRGVGRKQKFPLANVGGFIAEPRQNPSALFRRARKGVLRCRGVISSRPCVGLPLRNWLSPMRVVLDRRRERGRIRSGARATGAPVEVGAPAVFHARSKDGRREVWSELREVHDADQQRQDHFILRG